MRKWTEVLELLQERGSLKVEDLRQELGLSQPQLLVDFLMMCDFCKQQGDRIMLAADVLKFLEKLDEAGA